MSGEGVVGLALVGVIGGGVLVASRLAVGATGVLGAGLAAIGDRSDAAYQRWQHDQQVAAVWECAAREVIDRNARIAVLRTHGAGDPAVFPAVPTPFVLNGQPLDELREWVSAADRALGDAEEAMAARARRAVRAFLGSVLADVPRPGAPEPRTVHADEAIARFRALREAGTPAEPSSEETAAEVARILDRLAADVADTDRADVLAVAAAVVGKRGGDRHSQLEELRVRVRRANTAAKGRRAGRRTAAVYLQALERSSETTLRGQLADVIAGRRDLDPALDAAAVAECDRVRTVEELAYVRRRATAALEALGYTVDPEFTTHVGDGERLRLVRDDWTEHAVGVVLDGEELRTSVLRTAARGGDDAVRVDAEREQEWCAAFDVLRAELADSGLEVEVTHLTHPGERPVPVAAARPKAVPGRRLAKEQARDGRR